MDEDKKKIHVEMFEKMLDDIQKLLGLTNTRVDDRKTKIRCKECEFYGEIKC